MLILGLVIFLGRSLQLGGSTNAFISYLLVNDGSDPLTYEASSPLYFQLMEQYLQYWSQRTGGTYSLTMADA